MELYPHNQQAVEAVLRQFANDNKAAVVHPTGTGKSFIIAAVVEHYDKCLIVAPNDYILHETRKICKEGTHFHTYTAVMLGHATDTDYDLIVLDEYHRAGAAEWGASVQRLISDNPQAKLLGTTATDIRYLDNARNMSDEIFDGKIVSRLSLADAWVNRILIPPIYITGLFSFDNLKDRFTQRITENTQLSEERKYNLLSELDSKTIDWSKTCGIDTIFRNNLRQETKRMIVFCDHINNIHDIETRIVQWLSFAGFNIAHTYAVTSDNANSEKELLAFSEDDYDGIKLLFAVNMLNEGVHIPNSDAVVLLRSTTSKIIHLQQIGRCMSAGNDEQPVIFDIVDNLSSSDIVAQVQKEYQEKKEYQKSQEKNDRPDFSFIIKDYLHDIREVAEKLDNILSNANYTKRLAELKEWCETNNRFPVARVKPAKERNEDERTERSLASFCQMYKDRDEVIAIRDTYAAFNLKTFAKRLEILTQWVETNKKRPSRYRANKIKFATQEEKLENDLYILVRTYKDNEAVKNLVDKYTHFEYLSYEDKTEILTQWCKEHGTYPRYVESNEEENRLASYFRHHLDDPIVSRLAVEYNYITPQTTLENKKQEVLDFVSRHGRLPKKEDPDEKRLYTFYYERTRKRNQQQWALELRDKYAKGYRNK